MGSGALKPLPVGRIRLPLHETRPGMKATFNWNQLLTVTFTLFAVIDIIGSIPLLHALKKKLGGLHEGKATLISGMLMIIFLYAGEKFLQILGVDQRSFAVGGSIVIFILGLDMVLGVDLFKSGPDAKDSVL